MLVIVTSFAFRVVGYPAAFMREIAVGAIWINFLFAAVLLFEQSFALENENDALTGLLLTRIDPILVFQSRFLVCWLHLVLIQAVVIFGQAVFFGASIDSAIWSLLMIAVAVSAAFSAIGSLLAAVAASSRARHVLLPLLLFPLTLPLLSAAIIICRDFAAGVNVSLTSFWPVLLAACTVVYWVASSVLFEYVVAE
jgi:heme exporter protein B